MGRSDCTRQNMHLSKRTDVVSAQLGKKGNNFFFLQVDFCILVGDL